jgi:hypothetical protein
VKKRKYDRKTENEKKGKSNSKYGRIKAKRARWG